MAVTTLSPYSGPTPYSDLVTFEEASALFRETGHPASVRTLRRLVRLHGTGTERHGRTDYASWSDLLEIHARWVDARSGQ